MDRETYAHPSYGQIRFSRVSGTSNFYGSELQQDHYISMEIHTSEVQKDLSNDWYHNRGLVTRLRMTANQFSELITSMNNGSGVPCTLEFYNKEKTEKLPEIENRKEFTHRKFQERMSDFAQRLNVDRERARELINKKTPSKEDQKELYFIVEKLQTEISSNIPFFAKCFQEVMDDVVIEAKSEIENAIQHKITTLGLESLHEQQNLLKA